MSTLEKLKAEFQRIFGTAPEHIIRAPGRVNLIGEHTDYNEGYVLPMAIDRELYFAARRRDDYYIRIYALDFGDQADEIDLTRVGHHPEYNWANYIRGVTYFLQRRGFELPGLDAAISSNLPRGSGLSSSAAVEVATALTLQTFGGFELGRVELAQLCQRAENEFVGVKSGIMDQFACALSRQGDALLIDCRDLSYRCVPLPPNSAVVIADTRKHRSLAASGYNTRRMECENATMFLSQLLGKPVRSLREVSLKDFRSVEQMLPPNLAQRARHVITENERVLQAVNAAKKRDAKTFGRLMNESHESLRKDYEVSSAELDIMVENARKLRGCLGARLTGAGFGGSTVNLVREADVENFISNLTRAYTAETNIEPIVTIVRASAGASVIE